MSGENVNHHPSRLKKSTILMIPSYAKSVEETNPYQGLLSQGLESEGVKVKHWSYCQGKLPICKAAIAKNRFVDIVHIHWIYLFLEGENKLLFMISCIKFLADVFITRLAGLKIVWTVHNSISHDSKFPSLELWTRQQFVKLVDRVICLNKMTLETIAKEYRFNPAKAVVIPHGHYRDVYHPSVELTEARKELGLPESGRLYLNLGLLRPYKGIENLLQVWRENQDIFAGDILLIAGKPSDESYAEKLQQLAEGIEGIFIYPQFVENSKLHLYFSAANVVVLPFKKILNSGSFILAMSFGKPVIAPRLGGLLEVAGDADELLYDSEDEVGLQKAMQKSSEIDLEQLSKLVEKACDRLDWNLIAQQTLGVYNLAIRREGQI